MPSPQTIIDQLTLASNNAVAVAIGWHVAIAVATVAVMLGWRPSKRAAGVMLTAPIVSAAAVALAFGNPFNGSILAALALALVLLARRLGPGPVARRSAAAAWAGILLIVFGAFYPHFLQGGSPLAYLYAAPTGLIPCPTLSLVIGFALLAGGLGSRAWSLVLAGFGLFYGLFGVARLHVYLDIPLILGAAALLSLAIGLRRSAPAPDRAVRWADDGARAGAP
jgi:hypothetical protein